jgi:hypothetical protein
MISYLRKKIGKLLEAHLLKNVLVIRPIDDSENIRDFIKKLQPYQTNFPLRRIGLEKDGGYLVPDDLEGITACFSAGIGGKYHFEDQCFDLGMQIFMADKSVKFPEEIPIEYHFLPKFIGYFNSENFITLDDWVNQSLTEKKSDLLLQMDIESAEYFSLLNLSDALLRRFRVLVIEFHGLSKLRNREFSNMAEAVFQKLLHTHTCVHIHPNNCSPPVLVKGIPISKVMEFTFLRNDRISEKTPQTVFPHPLDRKNISKKEDSILPEIWYKP